MRPALALGVVLLGLALAREFAPRVPAAGPRAGRPLELVVGAKGPLLPAGLLGSGPERIGEAMRIGERTLVADGGAGLRACFVEPTGALRDVRRHDIGLGSGLDTLAEDVERARVGDVLLLASSGSLVPREDAERLQARSDELLARLGARTRPGRHARESFALITLLEADGWRALAEGASPETGVVLAFTLGAERALPAGFVGDLVETRARGGTRVELERELAHAQLGGEACVLAEGRVGGRPFPSLRQAARAEGARITWREVALGEGSGLLAWVGLEDGAAADSAGASFEVWIDGRRENGVRVSAGGAWRLLQVDLRAHAGRLVTLELVFDGASGAGLWGRPMLVHGFERSPLEVWAEQR